jgi:hypothetical protein
LCRKNVVGGKTSDGAISLYERVDCYDERDMESQTAKVNVERKMALLQN